MSNSLSERDSKVVDIRRAPAITSAKDYFGELGQVLRSLSYSVIDQITALLLRAYEENRSIYLFGNGGSASLASHAACDLGKGTSVEGLRRFRVLALTDNIPTLTAWANDASYEDVFAEQLRNFARKGDVVLAISGSGNSANVLKGLKVGRELGAHTIGLTGYHGGKMKELCDLCLVVPSDNMQFIEDLHVCISHSIFTSLRSHMEARARALQADTVSRQWVESCPSVTAVDSSAAADCAG